MPYTDPLERRRQMPTSITITDQQRAQLDILARTWSCNRSSVIRRILDQELPHLIASAAKPPKQKTQTPD